MGAGPTVGPVLYFNIWYTSLIVGNMKTCPKCNEAKPFADFNKSRSRKDGHQPYCRVCQRRTETERYRPARKEYLKEARKKSRRRNGLFVQEFLKGRSCVDCGEADPIVLEFDHVDPDTKDQGVANLVSRGCSIARIEAEIAKCVIRCANCHRRKTAQQLGWYEYQES